MEVREPSARYLAKPAYKQTEVGVIPEDWDCPSIRQIAANRQNAIVGGPFGSDLVSNDYVAAGVPVVRGQNMARHYVSGEFVFVSKPKAKQLQANIARPNDIIFTQRGTLGQVSIVPSEPFDEYVVSQSQMKLTLDLNLASPEYVYQYFVSVDGQRQILDSAIQTGVPHTNLGILRAYRLPAPPNLSEQQAIAEALSDADALVDALEQLLAKKRQIKLGAMQELLTGQKRLPGFAGEWQTKPLDELFDFSGGFAASRDQLGTNGHCYLHYGDIHTTNKTYVDVRAELQEIPKLDVPLKKVGSTSLLNDGDVVFVDASEDDEGTSKHVVVVKPDDVPFISGLHTIVAKSKTGELGNLYKQYCFQTPSVKAQFRYFAVGTKVSGVSKSNIGKITISVPPSDEQTAIATLLSDMDAEIAAIEAKLAKARELKLGMMAELLTGRIRLV
ncbi:MAG: restriction endonuclease subunit S [Rhodocyclaceae bacterium]|nr:restriction endonuclease subunit S [Rhodocyclaceae bacterium]